MMDSDIQYTIFLVTETIQCNEPLNDPLMIFLFSTVTHITLACFPQIDLPCFQLLISPHIKGESN